MANKIGNPQFHVMCEMWGVDNAIEAVKRMGMSVTKEQIRKERDIEAKNNKRWGKIFNKLKIIEKEKEGRLE